MPKPPDRPLTGLRVLDLSRILAGPHCTMLLGDAGADVIKVERPGTGDDTRTWGPPWVEGQDADGRPVRESTYFLSCNRNKRSVALDLKTDAGRATARALALRSDVLVHNFLPGTIERFGLGHVELLAEHPRLVHCAISAYGEDGPYADRPGYDMVLSAVGGFSHITGERGGPPGKLGVAICDVVTGVHAFGAITAALLHRERTGRGQHLDVALLDAEVSSLANVATAWLLAGREAERWGTAHASIVPYQVFPTADRPLAVAAANPRQWERLCDALERPAWKEDPRFATNADRVAHRELVVHLVEEALAPRGAAAWTERLVAAGVPCGPVNDLESLFDDPQVRHRALVETVAHPTLGDLAQVRTPARYSDTPARIDRPPPRLGEHTEEVLAEVLGEPLGKGTG